MAGDCGATLVKYILCLWNFLFFLIGASVLALGIWLAVDKESLLVQLSQLKLKDPHVQYYIKELTEPTVIEHGAYILLACGAFIFLIAALGYCGALRESRTLLTSYALFILIVIGLQVAGIASLIAYRRQALVETHKFFQHTIERYYTVKSREDAVTLAWNSLMVQMQCCGLHNSSDFLTATEFVKYTNDAGNGQVIPYACCKLRPNPDFAPPNNSWAAEFDDRTDDLKSLPYLPVDQRCVFSPDEDNSYFNIGCYDRLADLWSAHQYIIVAVILGLMALQMVEVIFAFCLCRAVSVRQLQYEDIYYGRAPDYGSDRGGYGGSAYPMQEYSYHESPYSTQPAYNKNYIR